MSGECEDCGATMGECYCDEPRRDFVREYVTRALTAQAFRVALAALWSDLYRRNLDEADFDDDDENDTEALAILRDLAALPSPAELAAELLGDE